MSMKAIPPPSPQEIHRKLSVHAKPKVRKSCVWTLTGAEALLCRNQVHHPERCLVQSQTRILNWRRQKWERPTVTALGERPPMPLARNSHCSPLQNADRAVSTSRMRTRMRRVSGEWLTRPNSRRRKRV